LTLKAALPQLQTAQHQLHQQQLRLWLTAQPPLALQRFMHAKITFTQQTQLDFLLTQQRAVI
jgi:hypothetical protein